MTAPGVTRERVRIGTRSIVLGVGVLALGVAGFGVLVRSQKVLGWLLAALVLAGIFEPAVAWVGRRVRRGLAVAIVAVTAIGATAGVVYGLVDGIARETRALETAAPARIAELESSDAVGEFVREARLVERTEALVESIPAQLFGERTPSGVVRAAVDRVVSLLVVVVLTLFLLVRGPRLAHVAQRLPLDDDRRSRIARVLVEGSRRGLGYVRRTLVLAGGAGVVAYGLARAVAVPGPAPLAVWAALWDLVPVAGTVVGFGPIVALALVGSTADGAVVVAGFVVYEVAETALRRRWVEPATLRLGPYLTAVALFAGIELAGVFGAIVVLAVAAVAAGIVDAYAAMWPRTDAASEAASGNPAS